ncbi:hypothetical protein [Amphritea sp.]|uniref:hypothetical protein n=1 Tax=Amphritea sp. TaxID=1872502 RepID=UPI003D1376AD
MKKLLIASTVLMSALTLSIPVQAGIYDYSRSANGELIHESTEQGVRSHAPLTMSAGEKSMTTQTLWQWDDVNYK